MHFEYTISHVALKNKINFVLLSSCLQYLENYEEIIEEILNLKARYIFIDRTLVSDHEYICIQEVPKAIYEAKYPVLIFDENNLLNRFKKDYDLIIYFHSYVDDDIFFNNFSAYSKAYVLKKKYNY